MSINDYVYLSKFIRFKLTKENLKTEAIELIIQDDVNILKDKYFFNNYVYPNKYQNIFHHLTTMERTASVMTAEREKLFVEFIVNRTRSSRTIQDLESIILYSQNYKILQSIIFINEMKGAKYE